MLIMNQMVGYDAGGPSSYFDLISARGDCVAAWRFDDADPGTGTSNVVVDHIGSADLSLDAAESTATWQATGLTGDGNSDIILPAAWGRYFSTPSTGIDVTDFTVCMLLKTGSATHASGEGMRIFGSSGTTATKIHVLYEYSAGAGGINTRFRVLIDTVGAAQIAVSSSHALAADTVYFVVVTYSNSGDIARLYINDVQRSTSTAGSGNASTTTHYYVGRANNVTEWDKEMQVSEISLHNAEISAADLTDIYDAIGTA